MRKIIALVVVLMLMLSMSVSTMSADETGVSYSVPEKQIAFSWANTAVVKTDHSMWMWGSSDMYGLEQGTENANLIPHKIADDVKKIEFGENGRNVVYAVLKTDGILRYQGAVLDDVADFVLSGDSFCTALKTDGTVWIWGDSVGSTPKKVMTDVKQLGDNGFSAITKDGKLIELKTTDNNAGEFTVVETLSDVESFYFSKGTRGAIKKDGSLWMWGNNLYGLIRDSSEREIVLPVKVMDDVADLSLSVCSTAAYNAAVIKTDGSLWIWGNNEFGQIGNGTTSEYGSAPYGPTKVMENVFKVVVGYSHVVALKNDGTLWSWGNNECGQVGANLGGNVNEGREPIAVEANVPSFLLRNVLKPVKILDDVVDVFTNDSFSAAVKKDGSLWMWGNNQEGMIGDGEFGEFVIAPYMTLPAGSISVIAASNDPINTGTNPVGSHEDNCPSKKFADVESKTTHWTHLPIDYVLEKGYMAGISETKFEPYSTVSRAMVVQVLYAMEGKPAVASNAGFKDVMKGKWYANAVNWAASKGIVAGYTNGNFGINDPVKRQDLVAIMYKYATYKKYDTALNGDISKFADKTNISTYAVNGMRWGVGHSIISGIKDGNKINAQPKASANRAQLAVILKAFDQNVKK